MHTDSPDTTERLRRAYGHHQAGRLQVAEQLYREVLRANPDHADANHLLGVVALQTGRNEAAVELITKAIEHDAGNAAFFINLGNAWQQQGAAARAIEAFGKALDIAPDNADAHFNLGNAYAQSGEPARAVASYRRALDVKPDHPVVHNNLGNTLVEMGDADAAIEHYRRALELAPDYAEAQYNLANSLHGLGRLDAARDAYEQTLRLAPGAIDAQVNLGNVYKEVGDATRAAACYRQALELEPDFVEALLNLGTLLVEQGEVEEATAMLGKAAVLKPDSAPMQSNLGNALKEVGRLDEAIAALERARSLDPASTEIISNLGTALHERGRIGEAVTCLESALALDPGHVGARYNLGNALLDQGRAAEALAAFTQVATARPDHDRARSNLLLSLNYLPDMNGDRLLAEHRERMAQVSARIEHVKRPRRDDAGATKGCLRVGYVSPDFRQHPIAHFMEPILRAHDRDRVAVFCYSDVHRADEAGERLAALAGEWRSTARLDDTRLAEQIVEDGIDVLVDLAGHTGANRLGVFARKPARVQVSYLGYPCTTGLGAMDYRLTDAIADPPGAADRLHTETLVRLAEGFCCYSPPRAAPAVSALPADSRDHITFGSLNQLAKLSELSVALWSRILAAVPGARLVLQAWALGDEESRGLVAERLAAAGIDPSRVEMLPPMPLGEHLGVYGRIDIALDTAPWNGHTTTCHALWMGVPVVTMAGERFASRTSASVLSHMGSSELIGATPDEYVHLAQALADNPERLREHRATLRSRMQASRLMDAERFTAALEDAYAGCWQRWCES